MAMSPASSSSTSTVPAALMPMSPCDVRRLLCYTLLSRSLIRRTMDMDTSIKRLTEIAHVLRIHTGRVESSSSRTPSCTEVEARSEVRGQQWETCYVYALPYVCMK